MVRGGSVYIVTNKNKTTLYTGVTSDLQARISEHKDKVYQTSFTARYNLTILVYHEGFHSIEEAIAREKYIKGKSRKWKNELIGKLNPSWKDLYSEIINW
ncbi:MAG: GIY-YIG nuclease family protein [Cyclobacteriaceae bacterium]|nr:GIY-YIG nuclease family protein [Cyclobacteriaceae bacterium]